MNSLLTITEKYGNAHSIKFNPEKTELMIFNHSIKRSGQVRRLDDWDGDLTLGGNKIKIVGSLRYLGSWLNDKLSAKEHIAKKRNAAFNAFNRFKNLVFSSVHTGAHLKGNMYKVYIRTIALYGLENFRLSTSELENWLPLKQT